MILYKQFFRKIGKMSRYIGSQGTYGKYPLLFTNPATQDRIEARFIFAQYLVQGMGYFLV
ncbi:hypothetical protein KB553_09445 [Chryseobacterium rhizoplanae]|uniref:hypothetical protein n=1 Tax=Chryseobacterium rhizoplanae TaxID=1609531 RepID=UPI001CE30184|nr:hypothetical protein [Chryseobacterium rhizoplanae]UCA61739.1 hypothetical protein KB553_09445 [Chryseobacterium rhizoplanae]